MKATLYVVVHHHHPRMMIDHHPPPHLRMLKNQHLMDFQHVQYMQVLHHVLQPVHVPHQFIKLHRMYLMTLIMQHPYLIYKHLVIFILDYPTQQLLYWKNVLLI